MYLASVGELNISKSLDSDHNASSKAELTNILPFFHYFFFFGFQATRIFTGMKKQK